MFMIDLINMELNFLIHIYQKIINAMTLMNLQLAKEGEFIKKSNVLIEIQQVELDLKRHQQTNKHLNLMKLKEQVQQENI